VTAAIELRGVGKRFVQRSDPPSLLGRTREAFGTARRQDLWAVRGVDLEIQPGERVGVVGSNGSGKTTMLSLLAGVTSPTEGSVRVRGRVSPLIAVGVGFDAELTGRENVRINATVLGLHPREVTRRFDEIVDFSGVADFLDVPVKFYSSGMLVRLGFSVATAVNPDVLLVDEVLAVGDLAFQARCEARMAEVAEQGTTVVVVSHNLAGIRALCPRSVLMSKGHVLLDGETPEVLDRYVDLMSGFTQDQDAARVGQGWDAVHLETDSGHSIELGFKAAVPSAEGPLTLWVGVVGPYGEPVYSETLDVAGVRKGKTVRGRIGLEMPLSPGTYTVHGALRGERTRPRFLRFTPATVDVSGADASGGLAHLPSELVVRRRR
jgi:ABC-type polysaccharide/polyol phosphate transport system ATPase subunit